MDEVEFLAQVPSHFEWWCEECRRIVGISHQKLDGSFCLADMKYICFRPVAVAGNYYGWQKHGHVDGPRDTIADARQTSGKEE